MWHQDQLFHGWQMRTVSGWVEEVWNLALSQMHYTLGFMFLLESNTHWSNRRQSRENIQTQMKLPLATAEGVIVQGIGTPTVTLPVTRNRGWRPFAVGFLGKSELLMNGWSILLQHTSKQVLEYQRDVEFMNQRSKVKVKSCIISYSPDMRRKKKGWFYFFVPFSIQKSTASGSKESSIHTVEPFLPCWAE